MGRKIGLFCACGLLLPFAFAASASAQGSTLQVDVQAPTPGQVINLTGTNFSGAAGNSPVTIRLSRRNGTVLASPTPDSSGRINASFPVPPTLAPGWYLLLAVQTTTANDRMRAFTPGRTRIRVRTPGSPRGGASAGGGGGLPGSPGGLALAGSGLLLLAGGAALTARRLRTRPQHGG